MNRIEYRLMFEVENQHWWYVALHELVLSCVERESRLLGRQLRIFDAGCGTGRLCQLMRRQGHQVDGCDTSDEALRLCKERGVHGMTLTDLNRIELKPGKYDLITSMDVLYHTGINDDVEVLRRLRKGLRPNGMLLLNLVAHEFLRSSHDLAVHTRERYSRQVLIQRLQEADFDVCMVGGRIALLLPLIAIYRLWCRLRMTHRPEPVELASDVTMPSPLINNMLLKALRLENKLIFSGRNLPTGSSLFAIARRSFNDEKNQSGKSHAS